VLQFVADNYLNTEEGKKALEILTEFRYLKKMEFSTEDSQNIEFVSINLSEDQTVALRGETKEIFSCRKFKNSA
jgi:uncharacterized protein YlbG (UPF0298 family)